ncbi:MAG: hypothetical protein H7263_04710 [Candidatus Sericytochromatia bacterium]|nr:hypothetical protein [Candidatus Sericytochromatia bacterium]
MMSQKPISEYSISELVQAKFLELRDNKMSKYFFLYFLHLMGFLDYSEEKNVCTYSKDNTIFKVEMPVIDSHEKYSELERLHKNLEKFFNTLKKNYESELNYEAMEIHLLDDLN